MCVCVCVCVCVCQEVGGRSYGCEGSLLLLRLKSVNVMSSARRRFMLLVASRLASASPWQQMDGSQESYFGADRKSARQSV